jgi:hypothetical protein
MGWRRFSRRASLILLAHGEEQGGVHARRVNGR